MFLFGDLPQRHSTLDIEPRRDLSTETIEQLGNEQFFAKDTLQKRTSDGDDRSLEERHQLFWLLPCL